MALAADDLTLFCEWFFEHPPLPWQHWFYHKPQKRKTLIAGIRSGKTYCVSLSFPHFALFNPYSRLANASISADQAKIVFYNVLQLVSRPKFQKYVKNYVKSPIPTIELINGSEMVFRSVGYEAELWRGMQFDWINIDEAAYIGSKNTLDTLDGRLLGRNTYINKPLYGLRTITTSPKGRGWLQEEFRRGDPGSPDFYLPDKYLSVRVRTIDNPFLDKWQVEQLLSTYSDRQRKQELEGAFLDPEDAVFSWEAIQMMSDPARNPPVQKLIEEIDALSETPVAGGFVPKVFDHSDYQRYQLPPGRNKSYLISWDIGTTATHHLGRNATVGMVFDITDLPWRLVAYRREARATYAAIVQWIREWHWHYNAAGTNAVETVLDSTGSGNPIKEILEDEYGLNVDGVYYSMSTKPDIINAGQIAIERMQIVCPPIRALIDELSSYEMDDKRIVQDCVMAFCQGLHRARLRSVDLARSRPDLILPTRTGFRESTLTDDGKDRYDARRQRSSRTNRDRSHRGTNEAIIVL